MSTAAGNMKFNLNQRKYTSIYRSNGKAFECDAMNGSSKRALNLGTTSPEQLKAIRTTLKVERRLQNIGVGVALIIAAVVAWSIVVVMVS